jgi:hypothetical protein
VFSLAQTYSRRTGCVNACVPSCSGARTRAPVAGPACASTQSTRSSASSRSADRQASRSLGHLGFVQPVRAKKRAYTLCATPVGASTPMVGFSPPVAAGSGSGSPGGRVSFVFAGVSSARAVALRGTASRHELRGRPRLGAASALAYARRASRSRRQAAGSGSVKP